MRALADWPQGGSGPGTSTCPPSLSPQPRPSPADPATEVRASSRLLTSSVTPWDRHLPSVVPKTVPNHILALQVEARDGKIQTPLGKELQYGGKGEMEGERLGNDSETAEL